MRDLDRAKERPSERMQEWGGRGGGVQPADCG